jgi:secreted PhoX family phosphatase
MDRFCSASGIEKGKYGFADDLYFTGEETSPPYDARGGQMFTLDVQRKTLYCVPAVGRAAFESVCVMGNMNSNKVVLLIGDDRAGAPLLLYIGEKNADATGNAPQRLKMNGLAKGNLYVWVSDNYAVNGENDPQAFNGTGNSRTGKFVRIDHYNPAMAGMTGYDAAGWADIDTQDALATSVGNFRFSRPEDVATNPYDGTQAVMNSTGRGQLFPADNWGTVYKIDLDDQALSQALQGPLSGINNLPAEITIL